jgi:hypothetical protein
MHIRDIEKRQHILENYMLLQKKKKSTALFLLAQCRNMLIEHDKWQDEDMMLQLISRNTAWIIE